MKTERIVRQCVLLVLLALGLAMTFAIPLDSTPSPLWEIRLIISKILAFFSFRLFYRIDKAGQST